MSDTPSKHSESESIDFFISRAGAQANIAKRIGSILEDSGHSTVLQDWDFHDKNFLERMHDALKRASRVILLLSPEYLASPYCTAEWTNAMAGDPLNKHGRIIFLRVAECSPDGMLRGMSYLDLVSLFREGTDKILREVILATVSPGRQRSGPEEGFWRTSKPILHTKIRPPPNFAGRRSDLDALDRTLTFANPETEKTLPPRAAIHGLPGAGKSALAIQYAWENQSRYAGIQARQ
jgi:TIR domain